MIVINFHNNDRYWISINKWEDIIIQGVQTIWYICNLKVINAKAEVFGNFKNDILTVQHTSPEAVLITLTLPPWSNQKISYNRSTNRAVFCTLQWMFFKTPFPSMKLK